VLLRKYKAYLESGRGFEELELCRLSSDGGGKVKLEIVEARSPQANTLVAGTHI
jgi:hypothetical protein